jgi:hypothetical protein
MGLVPRLFAPVSGSAATMIADACWSSANASAGEISFAVLIGNESSSIPTACAAATASILFPHFREPLGDFRQARRGWRLLTALVDEAEAHACAEAAWSKFTLF